MSAVAPLQHIANIGPDIEKAREQGWTILSPEQAKVAIDFVTSGMGIKALASSLAMTPAEVKRILGDPFVRAFCADLQAEVAKHKIINRAWVENQILEMWPKFTGEEEVELINVKEGVGFLAKKFHSAEVASILKHFSGNEDQKKTGGVQVVINFGQMGVKPAIDVEGAEDV
jgi:hypothetical protein